MITELSIVIPTLNEAKYLPPLLESIGKQTFTGKLEVIVVDGQSKDSTVELARTFMNRLPGLQIIEAARKDIGYQRNLGARKAQYAYLLFLDADVLLPPKLLGQLARKVRLKGPFVVSVMHRFVHTSLIDRFFYGIGCVCLIGFLLFRLPVTNGDFMLTTKENFKRIEGFKEGVVIGEDIDFGSRSIKAGATHRFYWRPAVVASLRRAYTMGRLRMLLVYVPAFLRIARKGPIYPGQGFDNYPFGHF